MKILLSSATILAFLLTLGFVARSTESAQAWCTNPYYNRPNQSDDVFFVDLWYHDQPGITGVRSWIWNYDPFVWPSSSTSGAFIQLRASGRNWARLGWLEGYSDNRWTIAQWTVGPDPDDVLTHYEPPEPTNTFSYYEITYTNIFHFKVGNTQIWTAPAVFTPTWGEISGQITNLQSQMPGGYSNPDWFVLSYIKTANGAWITFNGVPYVAYGWENEFGQATSGNSKGIFDHQCAN